MTAPRDYSLTGPEAARAAERGLAKARWYQTPLPRDQRAALMVRTGQPAHWRLARPAQNPDRAMIQKYFPSPLHRVTH